MTMDAVANQAPPYHWSIPKHAEEDWSREKFPPEVADLLAERFASLRARDHLD
jgi:hypothetical protein